ncbi:MAG: hypothetical protein J2P25_23055 [Nocardiopsaceae bacterium]|nr:hypothetical protein [Nocardiopsaceae bacterium]
MNNGSDLKLITDEYVASIDASGELPLRTRDLLTKKIGDLLDGDLDIFNAYTVLLGIKCAERVWPIWERMFPDDKEPIELARRAVHSIITRSPGETPTVREVGLLHSNFDNKFPLGEKFFTAIYAGLACWAVARDVIAPFVDMDFEDDPGSDESESEIDIDHDDWEAGYYASIAVAGGATWEDTGDPEKRRQFWIWYLTSAVPGAFYEVIERSSRTHRRRGIR